MRDVWFHLGPGKSGSTWLYNFARENESVFQCGVVKETQYLNGKGADFGTFYKPRGGDRIICDFSNTYMFNVLASKRLRDFKEGREAENVVSTVLLRCPIKRALSHFQYLQASGLVSMRKTFEEHIADDASILWRSRYEIHLREFEEIQTVRLGIFALEDQDKERPQIIDYVLEQSGRNGVALKSPGAGSRFSMMEPRNRFLAVAAKKMAGYLREKNRLEMLGALKKSSYIRSFVTKPRAKRIEIDRATYYILRGYFEPTLEFALKRGLSVEKYWLKEYEEFVA